MADGIYLTYFPFAILSEEPKMTPYHKKLAVHGTTTVNNLTTYV